MTSQSKQPKEFPRWFLISWLTLLLAAPIIMWMLPADHFDEGESICPSVVFFDTECFGCGTTRATQHLHHGELAEALYFHNASPVIYLMLFGFWCWWTYNTAARLGLLGKARQEKVLAKLRAEAERRMVKKQSLKEKAGGS